MAVINDQCAKCSTAITVLTGVDVTTTSRRDGKQAIYPDEPVTIDNNYSIFRCRCCMSPADETVKSYAYE